MFDNVRRVIFVFGYDWDIIGYGFEYNEIECFGDRIVKEDVVICVGSC